MLHMPPGPLNFILGDTPVALLARVLAAMLTAGLLCYMLARYIVSPVVKLRAVTRQLTEGDLSARVGPLMGTRRDELADMGRDFDAMAARIEALLGAQQRLLRDISHELRSPLARLDRGAAREFRRAFDAAVDARRELSLVVARVGGGELRARRVEHARANAGLAFDVPLEGAEPVGAAALECLRRAERVRDHNALDELRRVRVALRPGQVNHERERADDETHREPEPEEDFEEEAAQPSTLRVNGS